MRASQELRWQQSIRDNEERRRRYEEASRRLADEQQAKAQEALERRRLERMRMDELMRNPAQQPAAPKKNILRKGAGAALRVPAAGTASTNQATKPPASAPAAVAAAPAGRDRPDLERQRREWSEGLKQYIARQRETLRTAPDGKGSDQADALSWQELKLAAEAGFEELLRHQEATAAGTGSMRCPGMSRAKGGGAVPAVTATVTAAAAAAVETGTAVHPSPAHSGLPAPAAASAQAVPSQGSSPTSKWALRMQHMLDTALTGTDGTAGKAAAVGEAAAPQNAAAGPSNCNTRAAAGGAAAEDATGRDQAANPNSQPQQQQDEQAMQATGPEAGRTQLQAPVPLSHCQGQADCQGLPEVQSGGSSPQPCTSRDSEAAHAAGSMQRMSASAQQAAAALRESMEKLHRATDVMRSTVRHSQQRTAAAVPASPRKLQLPEAEGGSNNSCCSPGVHKQIAGSPATGSSRSANLPCGVVRCSAGRCLLDAVATAVRSSRSIDHIDNSLHGSPNSSAQKSSDQLSPALEPPAGHSNMQPIEQVQLLQQLEQPNHSEPSSPSGLLEQQQWQQHLLDPATELDGVVQQPPWWQQQQQQQQEEEEETQPLHDPDEPKLPSQAGGFAEASSKAVGDTGPATGEAQAEGPTLDSLMAEVQQLAALRQALKAEFVAMGHGNIAAAMGTLGLSKSKAPPVAVQGQPASATMHVQHEQQQQEQEQPPSPKHQLVQQEAERSVARNKAQQQLRASLDTQKEACELPCAAAAATAAAFSTCNSSSSSSKPPLGRQEVVQVSAEQQVRMLIQQHSVSGGVQQQQLQQRPQEPMHQPEQQLEEGPETCTPLLRDQAEPQQLLSQQHQADYCMASLTGDAGGIASLVNTSTATAAAAEHGVPHHYAVADTSHAAEGAASASSSSLDGTAMHMSFSFGHGTQQQPGLSPPASPHLLQQVAGTMQQQHSMHLQSDGQNVQGYSGVQACLQQQQQQLVVQLQHQHTMQVTALEQQQHTHPMPKQPTLNNLQLMQAVAAVTPLLHWNLLLVQPGAVTGGMAGTPAAAAASATQIGVPVQQPVLVPYVAAADPAVAAAAAAQAASMAAGSRCGSPSHRPAITSNWISSSLSSNSSRQVSPLLSPGRVVAAAAAAANAKAAASSKPVTPPAQASSSGGSASSSSFLHKLSRQASAGKGGARPAVVSNTARQQSIGAVAEAAAVPVSQGSYLAAALAARERVEKEQAERQRIEAAAVAGKQAAARKLLQEQEAQRHEAARVAKQVAHVAIGSYTSQGQQQQQQQQQHGSPPRPSKPQSTAGSTAAKNSQVSSKGRPPAQPNPPPVQNSSPSPPRRVVRTLSGTAEGPGQRGLQLPPGASRGSSGCSTPSRSASRIPSAPGTPPASKQAGPLPLLPPVHEAAVTQAGTLVMGGAGVGPGGVATAAAGRGQLCESFDSDFDHLERELEADEAAGSTAAGAGQQVGGNSGFSPPVVPWQSAIAAAAAAAVRKHASKAAAEQAQLANGHVCSARPGSSSLTTDGRGAPERPPALQIPTQVAHSVSATPAAVSPAATARSVTPVKAKQPTGNVSPLPTRATGTLGSSKQQQQQQQQQHQQQGWPAAGTTARTPPGGQPSRLTPRSAAAPPQSCAGKPSAAAAAAAATGSSLADAHRLSMEEAELLASLQQLDDMQARVKQQQAGGEARGAGLAETYAAAAAAAGVAGNSPCKSAMPRTVSSSANRSLSSPSAAAAGRRPAAASAAGGSNGSCTAASAAVRAGQSSSNAGKAGSTAGAAPANNSKSSAPASKELRQTKVAARTPNSAAPAAVPAKQQQVLPQAGAGMGAGPGWFGQQWQQSTSGFTQLPAGAAPWAGQHMHQMQHMQMHGGLMQPGFGPPGVAWPEMGGAQQQQQQQQQMFKRHAAAAMAAAAPVHLQQAGQLPGLCHLPPGAATAGGMGMVPCYPQQLYWAAMQAQQFQQWQQQQQQQYGMMMPSTAGDVVGHSRPGSAALHSLRPPQSAPTGSQYVPGSSLLPTLHYQQTVMRNRTSHSGDSGDGSGEGGTAACSGSRPGALSGMADVWPQRGVERTAKGKGSAAAGARPAGQAESGSIRVYKAGLLL